MNSVFGGYFLGFAFGKYFLGRSVSGKVFFRVVQKYPTPLILVCVFIKSTPWALGQAEVVYFLDSQFGRTYAN